MIRNRLIAWAGLLLVLTATAHAGPLRRVGDAARTLLADGTATAGTVMAIAPVGGDSRQTAVLVLDTVVQLSLGCYVIPASDQRRFHRKVEPGSTFEALSYLGGAVSVGELDCAIVNRWTAQKAGNRSRREFLVGERGFLGPIMAYAMRGRPLAAEHFFPGGVAFAGVVHDLPGVVATLQHFGFDLSGVREALEPVPASVPTRVIEAEPVAPAGLVVEDLACRSALRQARDALIGLQEVEEHILSSSSGAGHHGETNAFRAAAFALHEIFRLERMEQP